MNPMAQAFSMTNTSLGQNSTLSGGQHSSGSELFQHSLYQPHRIGSLQGQGFMSEQQTSSSGTPSTSSATPSSQTPQHGQIGQSASHTPLSLSGTLASSTATTGSAGLESSTSASVTGQGQSASQQTASSSSSVDKERIYQWINELTNPETREHALLELSKKRESVPTLAPLLWNSFGVVAALLQEIMMVYPMINPPTLTAQQSNRVCNALALLQCIASHPETRSQFLGAHIPLYLYGFLHTSSKARPFEYLRLTSLGVVGALVKTDEPEVINFLLTTEIIPLCLRIMEHGSELSKTVATFILQKILLDEIGLSYICQTYERFSHVAMILGKMVLSLAKPKDQSARLLKHVVRCYLRLSDNPRAREALRQCLPDQLKDQTFNAILKDDQSTKRWLQQLNKNLQDSSQPSIMSVLGDGHGRLTM